MFDNEKANMLYGAETGDQFPHLGDWLTDAIDNELAAARAKFPNSEGLLAALVEEVGELAKALVEESIERVAEEGIQVAAMAARLIQEGDPTLNAIRERHGVDPFVP